MRKILSFAAIAAFVLGCSSCNKQAVPEQGEGTVIKTVSVDLGGSTRTRAASALAGEATINDATLFVWQHNGVSEPVLYAKTYAEATVFNFDLMFSDQTEYTYTINAWANMGELAAEPADSEVLFSNESADGVQMKGSRTGITQATAESVTIDMQRYVGKITVSEVAVEWTNAQNALQEFTLKSMYIANAGDKAEGAVATYNIGGTYSASAMDAMLYSPVSSVIADGAKYSTPQMMYAYGSGTTALVLECELGGQTMYYHVPYEPEANTHRAFKLTIRQAGADEPLGELPEEAIVANVTTLNVLGFDEDEESVDFGDKPLAAGLTVLPENEVMILHVNNTFYTKDQWEEYNIDESQLVGFAVSDGTNKIVLAPSISEYMKWGTANLDVDYAFTAEYDDASKDFEGYTNTMAILYALKIGRLSSAQSAVWASSYIFANGNKGYLPGMGELMLIYEHKDEFDVLFKLFNETTFLEGEYWSSTECYNFEDAGGINQYSNQAWTIRLSDDVIPQSNIDKDRSSNIRTLRVYSLNDEDNVWVDPRSAPIEGARIQHINGTLYTAEEWNSAKNNNLVNNSEAMGVVVSNGSKAFVVHPSLYSGYVWSNSTDFYVALSNLGELDMNGTANTRVVLFDVKDRVIDDAPAFTHASNVIFADGKTTGYLPAAGEYKMIYQYLTEYNECQQAIGGRDFDFVFDAIYMTSSQKSASNYYTVSADGSLSYDIKDSSYDNLYFLVACPWR